MYQPRDKATLARKRAEAKLASAELNPPSLVRTILNLLPWHLANRSYPRRHGKKATWITPNRTARVSSASLEVKGSHEAAINERQTDASHAIFGLSRKGSYSRRVKSLYRDLDGNLAKALQGHNPTACIEHNKSKNDRPPRPSTSLSTRNTVARTRCRTLSRESRISRR